MQNTDWRVIYHEHKKSTAVVETLFLTLLGFLSGYGLMREQAYFSAQGFSWLMLGPLLSGLRYGFVYALSSVILLFVGGMVAQKLHYAWASGTGAHLYLGLLFVAVAAGEFRDYWYRRLKRLNAVAHYLDERMTEITRAFNMLKSSHDRLEQLMASRTSLRDSLLNIRQQILLSTPDQEGKGLGLLILKSLAEFGSLQGASLHAIDPKTQQVNPTPMAVIGPKITLNVHDSLIQKMLLERQTVSLKLDLLTQHDEELLLAIPLIDVYGKMWGLVAVNKMPFREFKEDNIQLLAILSGYVGDLVRIRMQSAQHIGNAELLYFYVQVHRCMQDVINHNIPACLLGMVCKDPQYNESFMQIVSRQQRDLEQLVVMNNQQGQLVVLCVFPLTNSQGIEKYCAKFNQALTQEFNIDESHWSFYPVVLTVSTHLDTEMQLLADQLQLDRHYLESVNP